MNPSAFTRKTRLAGTISGKLLHIDSFIWCLKRANGWFWRLPQFSFDMLRSLIKLSLSIENKETHFRVPYPKGSEGHPMICFRCVSPYFPPSRSTYRKFYVYGSTVKVLSMLLEIITEYGHGRKVYELPLPIYYRYRIPKNTWALHTTNLIFFCNLCRSVLSHFGYTSSPIINYGLLGILENSR